MSEEFASDPVASGVTGDGGTVDPNNLDGKITAPEPTADGQPRKRRGRPPGSGTGSAKAKASGSVGLDLSSLTGMFVGAHAFFGRDELQISMEEGDAFLKAVQNVMRHYNVQTTQKTMDFVALFGTVSTIYAPRIIALVNNDRRKRPAATVTQLRTVKPAPSQPQGTGPQPDIQPDYSNGEVQE